MATAVLRDDGVGAVAIVAEDFTDAAELDADCAAGACCVVLSLAQPASAATNRVETETTAKWSIRMVIPSKISGDKNIVNNNFVQIYLVSMLLASGSSPL